MGGLLQLDAWVFSALDKVGSPGTASQVALNAAWRERDLLGGCRGLHVFP